MYVPEFLNMVAWNILSKTLRQRWSTRILRIPCQLLQKLHYSKDIKIQPQTPHKNSNVMRINIKLKPSKQKSKPTKKKRNIAKLTLVAFGTSLVGLAISTILVLGAPEDNYNGEPVKDDLSSKHIIKQYIIRTCRELDFFIKLIQVPLNEKLLPDPLDYPYLQPKYTLVLELTDVLVHLDWSYVGDCKFKKRPLLDHFLQTLCDSYEIIIYTAEQGRVVFSVTDVIDPKHIIAYKLVHGTTHFTGTNHVKKLNDLNRDLSKIICIDWNSKHLKYNPENLLCIKQWKGNDDDTSLLDLAMFLKTIADNDIEDVREVLQYYSKYEDPVEAFRKKQEKLIEELEEKAAAKNIDSLYKISTRFRI